MECSDIQGIFCITLGGEHGKQVRNQGYLHSHIQLLQQELLCDTKDVFWGIGVTSRYNRCSISSKPIWYDEVNGNVCSGGGNAPFTVEAAAQAGAGCCCCCGIHARPAARAAAQRPEERQFPGDRGLCQQGAQHCQGQPAFVFDASLTKLVSSLRLEAHTASMTTQCGGNAALRQSINGLEFIAVVQVEQQPYPFMTELQATRCIIKLRRHEPCQWNSLP